MIARMIQLSESAITVEFGDTIALSTNDLVLAFTAAVDQAGIRGFIEVVPTYRSATLYFDARLTDAGTVMKNMRALTVDTAVSPSRPSTTHTIPVWYGGAAGPDLPDVARQAGLTAEEAGELHASITYRVFMLGACPSNAPLLAGQATRDVVPLPHG